MSKPRASATIASAEAAEASSSFLSSLLGKLRKGAEDSGSGYERGGLAPPYLTPPGMHALDARIASEDGRAAEYAAVAKSYGEALTKFGYGSMVGEWVPEMQGGPNALPSSDDVHTLFTMAGALFPPYDPEVLSSLQEHSNSLRPNVDAYKTNIDGFGFRLEPVIALDEPDADEKVGDALYLDRVQDAEARGQEAPPYPEPEEIAAYKTEIKALMRLERSRVEQWFGGCAADLSFKELRRRTREDYEITGNAYWEVIRNADDEIVECHLVPSYSMRLAPIEHVLREVPAKRKVSPFRYKKATVRKRFRRYIQIVLDRIVYFKEYGDPRIISKRTGRVYASQQELVEQSQHDGPATEILHFRIYSPRSPYGVPRWIGNLLSVLGSRASEEVNYLFFDNKAVPPMAILVSGGKLAKDATKRIESYIADNIRGKENFHRILILEAEPAAGKGPPQVETGRVRIELVPMRDGQHEDALFQNYDQQNRDKVGHSFRIPRLLRGDTLDFNRATADAALEFAEVQVFEGERETFDDVINLRIFPELGIRFWTFKSNSPVNRDASDMTENLTKCVAQGIFTVEEAREIAGDIFNRKFPKLEGAWAKLPMVMILAGLLPDPTTGLVSAPAEGMTPPAGAPKRADGPPGSDLEPQMQRDLTTLAGRVMALRDSLEKASEIAYRAGLAKRTREETEPLVLQVPAETLRQWVTADGDAPDPSH